MPKVDEIELEHAHVLQLKPGDVVAITVKGLLSVEAVARLERAITAKLPPGTPLMFLTEDTKLSILRGAPSMETL